MRTLQCTVSARFLNQANGHPPHSFRSVLSLVTRFATQSHSQPSETSGGLYFSHSVEHSSGPSVLLTCLLSSGWQGAFSLCRCVGWLVFISVGRSAFISMALLLILSVGWMNFHAIDWLCLLSARPSVGVRLTFSPGKPGTSKGSSENRSHTWLTS